MKAWVDHIPHFGHTVTSRIEGSHAKLKSYLGTSTSELKGVYDKVVGQYNILIILQTWPYLEREHHINVKPRYFLLYTPMLFTRSPIS